MAPWRACPWAALVQWVAYTLHIDQAWNMFSPHPPDASWWYIIEVCVATHSHFILPRAAHRSPSSFCWCVRACVRVACAQGTLVNEDVVEMHRDRGMFAWKGVPLNGTRGLEPCVACVVSARAEF